MPFDVLINIDTPAASNLTCSPNELKGHTFCSHTIFPALGPSMATIIVLVFCSFLRCLKWIALRDMPLSHSLPNAQKPMRAHPPTGRDGLEKV